MSSAQTDSSSSSDDVNPLDRGLRAAFRRPSVSSSVLDALARTSGAIARQVMLREVRSEHGASPVVKPVAAGSVVPQGRDNYQVQGEIARGGMGAVLKAHDADLGRDVALKVLHETLAARPEVVQRFVEEAQIGGQIQHPGIVPVYELGLMADERPYFAMKLVKGKTLAVKLAERRASQAEQRGLLDVFEAICQTMAYAHSRGVIHRDLKPANVLIGAFGEVQVVDWGLAKVLRTGGIDDERRSRVERQGLVSVIETVRSAPGSDSAHSQVGSVLGTPAYMPPEQARGEVDKLDERSDVFSLGAILCEILTGRPPYTGEAERTLEQAALAELDDATKRLEGCAADSALVALAQACLAPAQSARPRSAEVLAEKLHAYLTSVEERAQSARIEAAEAKVRAVAERRARKLTLSLAAAVLALVLLGGGEYLWTQRQAADRMHATEQAVAGALQDATLARGREDWAQAHAALERARARIEAGDADDELRAQWASLGATIEGEAARAREALALESNNAVLLAALDDVRQPEGDVVYPREWVQVDASYLGIFREQAIEVDVQDVPGLALKLAARGIENELAGAFDEWALVRKRAGNTSGAARLLGLATALDGDPDRRALRSALEANDAVAVRRIAANSDPSRWPVPSVCLLARALAQGGAADESIAVLRAARLRFPSEFTLAIELGRALILAGREQTREAAVHLEAAVALRPDRVEAWHHLGRAREKLGEHAAALDLFRAALDRRPEDAHLHFHCGRNLENLGRPAEAQASYQRVIDLDPGDAVANDLMNDSIATTLLGTLAYNNLGNVLAEQGLRDEAIASFRRAIELDGQYARAHFNLGVTLEEAGELDEAMASFRRAIEVDPRMAAAQSSLGSALADKGDLDGAIACQREAIESDPKFAPAYNRLGNALRRKNGDLAGAIANYRKSIELDPRWGPAHNSLGAALAAQGDLDGAIASFREALAVDPEYALAHFNLGRALRLKGQLDEALASCRRAVVLDPEHHGSQAWLAWELATCVREDLRDPAQALVCARKAVEQHEEDANDRENLGVALYVNGEFEEAVGELERAIELDAENPHRHLFLALCYVGLEDFAEAQRWYARAQPSLEDMVEEYPELRRFVDEARVVIGGEEER